jgi:AraC family transcriptional regulator of adaptative response/methylated-DNA-[protein]-cysteine methyltransferase
MRPARFRNGGAQTTIRHGFGRSSLGLVLAAGSDRGICAILIGDDEGALLDDLGRRFPKAVLVPGDADFQERIARIVAMIEEPARGLALPLDIRGTAFQRRVWQALAAIPAGETRSYAELAEGIGLPRATRAVAGACAANPLAVAIPCHRAVRRDGSLSGYRWGVERKRALLDRERRG